jgi:hypothetical protein
LFARNGCHNIGWHYHDIGVDGDGHAPPFIVDSPYGPEQDLIANDS